MGIPVLYMPSVIACTPDCRRHLCSTCSAPAGRRAAHDCPNCGFPVAHELSRPTNTQLCIVTRRAGLKKLRSRTNQSLGLLASSNGKDRAVARALRAPAAKTAKARPRTPA